MGRALKISSHKYKKPWCFTFLVCLSLWEVLWVCPHMLLCAQIQGLEPTLTSNIHFFSLHLCHLHTCPCPKFSQPFYPLAGNDRMNGVELAILVKIWQYSCVVLFQEMLFLSFHFSDCLWEETITSPNHSAWLVLYSWSRLFSAVLYPLNDSPYRLQTSLSMSTKSCWSFHRNFIRPDNRFP